MTNKTSQKNISKGWRRVSLGEIAHIEKGEQLNRLDMEKDARYPALNGGIGPSGYTQDWNTEADTITISEGGNSCGYVNFVTTRFWCGGHCYSLLELAKDADTNFLYQSLKSQQEKLMKLRVGSGLPNIQKRSLEKFPIDLPSLSEQKKIVEILGAVDLEIEKTDAIIVAAEKLKQGLAQRLLTPGKDWGEFRLKEVATITRGGSPRPIESFITDAEDGLNWLRIGDIEPGAKYVTRTSQKIDKSGLSKTTLVKEGDFILSNSMSFGRPYIMKIEACIHDGWLAFKDIKADIADKEFLYYLLTSDKLQNGFIAVAAGSGVRNLKKESVANISVALPPIAEQREIAEALASVDEKISINQKVKARLTRLKKGLMQNLLSGRKRV